MNQPQDVPPRRPRPAAQPVINATAPQDDLGLEQHRAERATDQPEATGILVDQYRTGRFC